MKISQLVTCLDLEVLTMPEPDVQITGGYVGDLLSWVMGRAEAGHVWVTIMTNINILAVIPSVKSGKYSPVPLPVHTLTS